MKVKPKNSDLDKMQVETQSTVEKVIHRANERGSANHGWLQVNHSFSFAGFFDPDKVHFGALRVLNDDYIAPNKGFPTHPHDNMEIITIPLSGALAHKDSMGNSSTINAGEIQVMSAGEGVMHSEFNPLEKDWTNLFQIWIFPNKKNVAPRYDQFKIDDLNTKNRFAQLVSPNPEDEGSWIHQEAWINMGEFDANQEITYKLHDANSGAYLMVVEGEIEVENEKLSKRDAIGLSNIADIRIQISKEAKLMLLEVPMEFEIQK